ncbi:MAG: HD-GYP domain-containing protein [Deltaproteobacteria bacterium]|nr:HD-GYP domain-containing protein [Deltaproteobacteria bacterium]
MNYTPILLEIMQINEEKRFELYIKQEGKHILFVGKHVAFSEQHRNRLIESGTTELFVKDHDQKHVQQYTARHLDKILSNPRIPSAEKAKVFYTSSTHTMQRAFDDPRADTIADMKRSIKCLVKNIVEDQAVMQDLFRITAHDYYTYTHCVNVGIFATALAIKLFGLQGGKHDIEALSCGFFLHDIGKTKVPLSILNKPTDLNKAEWEVMKRHPQLGYQILLETGHLTDQAAHIILEHHEQHDGKGYPYGKKGDEIHLYARICAIADTFDALTTMRSYKQAKETFEALKYMKHEMVHEFDPEFFATFVMIFAPPDYKVSA